MIAIPRGPVRGTALVCLLALGAAGCGLSAELDRERNPERRPTPSPTRTTPSPVPTFTAVPSPSPSASVPVQRAEGCPASGVRYSTGAVDGAMGLRAMTLTLTNCGERSYRLRGYPYLEVLDDTGEPIPAVRSVQGTDQVPMAPEDPGPKTVTLAPGESARAGLYWRMAAEDGVYLRVGPGDGSTPTNVRLPEPLDIGPENVLGTTAWTSAEGAPGQYR
ncbi:DUF4232 domain-containing protein [Streptomyces sp. NPDC059785]|uniref:DUF4232 domain-containing protein n=1 Tax=Streptomyces sp. NPDC059785 TaxID=3346945 RepID=UPI00364B6705